MRIPLCSAALFLALLTPAFAAHRRPAPPPPAPAPAPAPTPAPPTVQGGVTIQFVPPAEPGDIFVVVDFARVRGTVQPIYVTTLLDQRRRNLVVAAPYQSCRDTTPAGVVLRIRHYTADTSPLTLQTTGTIVHAPFQGEPPLEVLHPCYTLMNS